MGMDAQVAVLVSQLKVGKNEPSLTLEAGLRIHRSELDCFSRASPFQERCVTSRGDEMT